ncbi:MAG: Gfo/Idh/MocA family oxidoreductase [Candidatus Hydrogenedentes bacterium]|nr:Gfo/Idh/MocA family oxidoreductase [Candidatus Hydrogenedentota bacterium]
MPRAVHFRAGIVGAGAIAQACHMPGYIRNKHCELVAFADPSSARHKELADKFPGVRGYTSTEEMLAKEKLDIISVCTPNKYHAANTIAALRAGCHVLCEKPIAVSLQEADRMIAAAKQARKKLMIGFTNRLYRGPLACKQMLQRKAIGKPFMFRVRFAHGGPYPGWAKDKWFYEPDISAGGAMLDMGIHAIDLALWLYGPIRAVSAKVATLVKRIPVDDNAVVLLEFASGALGYIEVGWTSKPGFTGIELYGTEGSLICDYVRGLQLCSGKASAGTDSVREWELLDDKPATGGWPVEIDYWMDVVMGQEKLTMDGAAGRAALEVALAAYKSSRTGKRITIG